MPGKVTPTHRKQRTPRSAAMPPLDVDTTVPYAECREEFAGQDEADLALDVVAHPVYQQIFTPALTALATMAQGKRGPTKFYGFQELETLLVYQRLSGFVDYAAARNFLAGDRGRSHRVKLGFDRPRDRTPGRARRSLDGVPCEKTVARYLKLWPEGRRAELLDRVFAAIRDQWLTTAEAQEECRRLTLDGSVYRTHYTCPTGFGPDGRPKPRLRKDRKTGEKVDTVTCSDGGFMGFGAGPDHAGDGWNWMPLATGRARVLTYRLPPNNASEKTTALQVIDDYAQNIVPVLKPAEIGVLSADAGFNAAPIRRAARATGLMANIPQVSGGESDSAKRHRERRSAKRYAIEGHPGWAADGFRELHCAHGPVATTNRSFRHPDGHLIERVEGRCRKGCGSITITNGDYRVGQNPDRLIRRRASDPSHESDDELFGSPLTQNSRLAKAFGGKRWGKHEGLNAALHTRFGLLVGKAWIRRRDIAHQNVAMTVMIQWILSDIADQRLSAGVHTPSSVPPPTALTSA